MARRQPYHYGSSSSNSSYNSYGQQNGQYGQQAEMDPLAANDDLIDGLAPKVTMLKSLALDMGDEIKSQNSLLSRMDNEFDSTWGFLSNSMGKVKKLAASGHNRWYLYMMAFAAFVFFFIWIIR